LRPFAPGRRAFAESNCAAVIAAITILNPSGILNANFSLVRIRESPGQKKLLLS